MDTVVTISVLLGVAAYLAFFAFCIANWLRGITGLALMLAGATTLAWVSAPLFEFSRPFYLSLEPVAIISWTILLVRALGLSIDRHQPPSIKPVIWTFVSSLILGVVASLTAILATAGWVNVDLTLPFHLSLLVVNILGLVLVEQLAQNALTDLKWRLRYLNIGLGMMFVYGLVHHALAIVFATPAIVLSALQPAVMALLVPFVVIASLRNRTNRLRFSLSRNFIFRTGVLVSTGTFLLLLGVFGYLAQVFAGQIGITVAVFIGIIATTFVLSVVGSSRIRSQLRVQVSKTFFEYRYDYRDEWMNVTAQLTEPDADFDLPQQAQRAMIALLHARQSCLWIRSDNGNFAPLSHIDAQAWFEPLPQALTNAFNEFFAEQNWVLDLSDLPEAAAIIEQNVDSVPQIDRSGYVIPLFVETKLFGICLVGPSEIPMRLSWEDYDIIKLISKQCAGFLALQDANQHLVAQQQLSAVNQMSAFLLHDIKTIAAQLSLMLDNAPKHRENPAFIDDMLTTTKNSVQRMERIIAGLRKPDQQQHHELAPVDLNKLLNARQERSRLEDQHIMYSICKQTTMVHADPESIDSALTHLEKNAVEAIDGMGTVKVDLEHTGNWAILRVTDDGAGMSEDFIKNNLFTPFHSSKGITGMGIGAYQAREKIQSCGGNLHVESTLGVGTTFTIKLPLMTADIET